MQPTYLKRAHKRFLSGTSCKTPAEAVESGLRSLRDWSQVLSEERERELELLSSKRCKPAEDHRRRFQRGQR